MSALPEFNLFGERTPPPAPPKPSFSIVYDAYSRAGGKLNKFERQVLGQQARKLVSDGFPIEQVAKAASQLGASGDFPAYLGRTLREMPEPCVNGEARSRLTQEQLSRCSCANCAKWLTLRNAKPLRF